MGARRADRPSGLSAATTVVGVIGYPVAHSLSPLLHNAAFADLGLDWVSVGFPVPAGRAGRGPGRGRGPSGSGACRSPCPTRRTWPAPWSTAHPGGRPARGGQLRGRRRRTGGWATTPTGPGSSPPWRRGGGFDPRRAAVPGGRGRRRGPGGGRRPGRRRGRRGGGGQPDAGAGRGGRRAWPGRPAGWAPPTDAAGLRPGGQRHPGGHGATSADGPATGRSTRRCSGPAQVVVDLVYHPPVTPWLAAAAGAGRRRPTGSACWSTRPHCRSSAGPATEAPVEAMWAAVDGSPGAAGGPS